MVDVSRGRARFAPLAQELPEFVAGAWIDLEQGHWHAVRGLIPELHGAPVLQTMREIIQGPGLRQLESILGTLRAGEPVKFREVILSAGVHLALVKVGERYPSRLMLLLFHASVPLTKMLSRARMLAADLESSPQ